jgi:hypothetical protein
MGNPAKKENQTWAIQRRKTTFFAGLPMCDCLS